MKMKLFLPVVLFVSASVLSAAAPEWKLIWSDEFNGSGKPDPKKWAYENEGFLRNREVQWYTKDLKNNFVKDGCLHLVALKADHPNPWYKKDSKNWKFQRERITVTSGAIISSGHFMTQYGRIEMRAKMPKGQGVWPAFWTIGKHPEYKGWPMVGEIDILEYFIGENGKTIVNSACHWQPDDAFHRQAAKQLSGRKLDDAFHIYAIEWDEQKIAFFLDKEAFFTFDLKKADRKDGKNAFRIPHFLLLNLAIGGSLGGKVDPNIFPAEYLIDYVRVYKKER